MQRLQVQPGLRVPAEVACQAHRGVSRNPAAPPNDVVDAWRRHVECLCKCICRQARRAQEVLTQYLTRVNRAHSVLEAHTLSTASVMVNDLDVLGSRRCPAKADAPLIVDANAVLALPVAFQCFKPIAGR